MKQRKMPVVHVRVPEMSHGPGFPDRRADLMRDLGYRIVPSDDPRHPFYVPCHICSEVPDTDPPVRS